MSGTLRLGSPEALDTAIAIAKRLGEAGGAELLSVDSTPHRTTMHLAVPASGIPGISSLRRQLWTSFVRRNVARREQLHADVESRVTSARIGAGEAARRVERVRAFLADRAVAS